MFDKIKNGFKMQYAQGRAVGRNLLTDREVFILRKILIALACAALVGVVLRPFALRSSALNANTYNHVAGNSSVVEVLTSVMFNQDSYSYGDDWIVFQDGSNSYYCFYGVISINNNVASGSDLNFVHYYSDGSWNSAQHYDVGTDSLRLNCSHLIAGNLPNTSQNLNIVDSNNLRYCLYSALLLVILTTVIGVWRNLRKVRN